jgi:hypothetical protein
LIKENEKLKKKKPRRKSQKEKQLIKRLGTNKHKFQDYIKLKKKDKSIQNKKKKPSKLLHKSQMLPRNCNNKFKLTKESKKKKKENSELKMQSLKQSQEMTSSSTNHKSKKRGLTKKMFNQ